VEDWTIQNPADENHEFHMHQIHFLLLAVNGVPVKPDQQQLYDGSPSICAPARPAIGRKLQGQPLWQLDDQHSHRRAPAHDETGHTWQHSDEEIFQMIKFGRFSTTPPSAVSYMPAFEDALSDPEILEVMAFIKARWPLGLRVSQEMLNPGFTGMPARANEIE
jgi:hypothetical protein